MSIAAQRSHAGDEYQLRIATHWLIQLLKDRAIDSVLVEAVSLPGQDALVAVDDVVVTYGDGRLLFVQAKKNQSDHGAWELTDRVLVKELRSTFQQLEQDAEASVIYYSRTPFGDLAKLVQDAPAYCGYAAFSAHAPGSLKEPLRKLADAIGSSEEQAFSLVARLRIGSHLDYDGWDQLNDTLLSGLTTNPSYGRRLLEDVIRRRQSGISGPRCPIRHEDIVRALETGGVYLAATPDIARLREEFSRASAMGRNWPRTIRDVAIPRPEVEELLVAVREQQHPSILLVDGPGTGKTCVLLSFVEAIEKETEWDLVFVRGDDFSQCSSEGDLVARGLPDSFVVKCATLASNGRVVVVLDSLDVLSLQGEHQSLRLFLNVLDRLLGISNVTCVVACRSFDLTYDPLLRGRKWDRTISLKPLDFATHVQPLLGDLGIQSDRMRSDLAELLTVPQNLRLFVDLATSGVGAAHWSAIGNDIYALHSQYLETVVRRDARLGDEALVALTSLAVRMIEQRTLCVSRSAASLPEPTMQRLISQGILLDTGSQTVRLGHQTLLDALVVRSAIERSETLLEFIRAHPPFPFIRPVVRAFVGHLRLMGTQIFGRQVREVFDDGAVPYHLKRAIMESFAEAEPSPDDWPLVRYLYVSHRDFFLRLIGAVRSSSWFRLLCEQWWPTLPASPEAGASKARFIALLDRWMNAHPERVVALWTTGLASSWGETHNVAFHIQLHLKNFEHWRTDGVEELLRSLFRRSEDDQFLGKPIAKFVENTGGGLDLLWQFITGDADEEGGCRKVIGSALRCEDYHFHRDGFLAGLLVESDSFLEMVLLGVEKLRQVVPGFNYGVLHETSWEDVHTRFDVRHKSGLRLLMDAVGEALRARAARRSPSWHGFESTLRTTGNRGLRYLLLRAYLEDVESNIEGIAAQLLDEDVLDGTDLEHELGNLTKHVYPYLSAAVQEQHQELLLLLQSRRARRKGGDVWAARFAYELLQPIPTVFRTSATQRFLDRWESRFGIGPRQPRIVAWGGTRGASVTTEQLLRLTPAGLERVLEHYEACPERSEWCDEGLEGGVDDLCDVIARAASMLPTEYLKFAARWWAGSLDDEYVKAAMRGASDHLKYRFGNLKAPKGWTPGDAPPDGETVVGMILDCLERYHDLWNDERAMARILEGCGDAVVAFENANRITWLLIRLTRAKDPTPERGLATPHGRQESDALDLLPAAMNTARGIAAKTTMTLASRMIELGVSPPELLLPALTIFASDGAACVRASLLRAIPYFLSKCPDTGWDLIARSMNQPDPRLWEVVERAFYHRIGSDFARVAPYLRRMLDDATVAGETWGRLTTIACLHRHVEMDAIFDELECRDAAALWKGVGDVFAANLDKSGIAETCRSGLLRALSRRPVPGPIIDLVDRHLRGDVVVDVSEIVDAVLDACTETRPRLGLFGVFEWVASAVDVDPTRTLPLLEKVATVLEKRVGEAPFLHSEPLIAALLVILREADQSGDAVLVGRALSLQDSFLRLNMRGVEEMLNAASARN